MPGFYKLSLDGKHHTTSWFYKTPADSKWHPVWTYAWEPSSWSTCSVTCGGGIQTRTAKCRRSDTLIVHDSFCNAGDKPALSQACNVQPCAAINSIYYYDPASGMHSDWRSSGLRAGAIAGIGSAPNWTAPPAAGYNTPCKASAYCGLMVGWGGATNTACENNGGRHVAMQAVADTRKYVVYHRFISFVDTKDKRGNRYLRLVNTNGTVYASYHVESYMSYDMARIEAWDGGSHTIIKCHPTGHFIMVK